ncbi:MAG: DUF4129 domain-containing protein [Cellulomonas sp.]
MRAVVVLAVVVVLGSAIAGPWVITGHPASWDMFPGQSFPTSAPESPRSTDRPVAGPSVTAPPVLGVVARVVVGLAVAALVALLVVVAVGLVRRARAALEQRAAEPEPMASASEGIDLDEAHLPVLRAAVARAGQHLDDAVPPGDAVISAWVALERAAEQTGVPRSPAATPTEFTVAVLDATRVDATAIRTLLELYLAARFSDNPLTSRDVERARTSLRTLADGLERRRSATDDAAPVAEP